MFAARVSSRPTLVTENGVDVRDYIHWSMMDNYEWLEGHRPKFGLVEVNRETQARKPKPSAYWLGEIVRKNAL